MLTQVVLYFRKEVGKNEDEEEDKAEGRFFRKDVEDASKEGKGQNAGRF